MMMDTMIFIMLTNIMAITIVTDRIMRRLIFDIIITVVMTNLTSDHDDVNHDNHDHEDVTVHNQGDDVDDDWSQDDEVHDDA